jgi:hypothetical protein
MIRQPGGPPKAGRRAVVEGTPGLVEVTGGIVGFQACEAAAEDVVVEACGEEDEATTERGELVAVAARQAFQQGLADEATEVVGVRPLKASPGGYTAPFDDALLVYRVLADYPRIELLMVAWLRS